jgi:hypothetical protein
LVLSRTASARTDAGSAATSCSAGERPVEAHFDQPHAFAAGGQGVHRLLGRASAGTHEHDHAFGVRRALVFHEIVVAPRAFFEGSHGLSDDRRRSEVESVARLPALKERVGVLGRPAHERRVRAQGSGAEREDVILGHQCPQVIVTNELDAVDLVRGAKPVEEVDERDACTQGGHMGDERHVLRFLYRCRRQHRPAGGARVHDVAVIPEDGERVHGHSARRHVDHGGAQLTGDLEHVGDHEQQALRGGEARSESASLQRSVENAGGSGL